MIHAPNAAAFVCSPASGSTCPHNVSGNQTSLKGLLSESGSDFTTNPASGATTSTWEAAQTALESETNTAAKAIRVGLYDARVSAGVLPEVALLGDIAVVAGGTALVYHITRSIDDRYLHLFGNYGSDNAIYFSSTWGVGWNNARWHWEDCSGTGSVVNGAFLYPCLGGGSSPVQGYVAVFQTDLGGGYNNLATYQCPSVGASIFGGASSCRDYQYELDQRYLHGNTANLPGTMYFVGNVCCVGGNSEATYARVMTGTQAMGSVTDMKDTSTYGGTPDGVVSAPSGSTTVTDPEATAAKTTLETGTALPSQWTDHILDPAVDDPVHPLKPWLKPNDNETATDYRTRLIASGLLGAITLESDLTNPLDGYGPESPVRITIKNPSGTTVRVLDPLSWPSSDPQYPNDYTTSITPNSADALPVGTGAGTCAGYLTASPDLSPLNVDVGSKFPFGVFTYVYTFISQFDVSPVTPYVDWNIHLGALSSSPYHFTADLHRLDTFMAGIRTLIAIFMVVGAIFMVATSFIKVGIGNPASTIDDNDDDPGAMSNA